ncbi:hypothetical protein BGY98DRAFT_923162, partial [Russula aff. rugulosa BPL654]
PFGECEPCPHEVLKEPFCQPFGNRRLLHCFPPSPPSGPDSTHSDPNPHHNPDNLNRPTSVGRPPGSHAVDEESPHRHPDGSEILLPGETIAWESCGRIVIQERADFYEFIACNLLFVCVALVLVIWRSKRMNTMQARQLAARIGLGRGYG